MYSEKGLGKFLFFLRLLHGQYLPLDQSYIRDEPLPIICVETSIDRVLAV